MTATQSGAHDTGIDALITELADIVGAANVLHDPALTASYETDWTRRFTGRSRCVVRPATTAEVAAVLVACHRHGAPVVVQGGNTGLVGGGVPAGGEVVLATRRLRTIEAIEEGSGHVLVGAGVTLAELQAAARPLGWDTGIDFAARDSCTVGGLVATNAGGENVLRHGAMRAQVLGLEAVLADGRVLTRLSGLPKDNTGYDLVGLLSGSEGTLAVLTRVLVRLVPRRNARAVAILGCATVAGAQRALRILRGRLADLESAELFFDDGLELVRAHTGLGQLMAERQGAYLLIEVAAHDDPTPTLFAAIEDVSDDAEARVGDVVVAEDGPTRERLWRYREAHTESVGVAGVPVKLDVAIPARQLEDAVPAFTAAARRAVANCRVVTWGHINEGNMHVNVLPETGGEFDEAEAEAVTEAVLTEVAARGGSISAEHGVGRAKAAWLSLTRSPAEIATMRAVKAGLDPTGLLGPGVVLPLEPDLRP